MLPDSHPLELIPTFRRWPRSRARNVAYTGIWSMMAAVLMAVVQTLVSGRGSFIENLVPMMVVSNIVGYLIHGGLAGMTFLLGDWPCRQTGWTRLAYRLVTVSILVTCGIAIGNAAVEGRNPLHYLQHAGALPRVLPFALVTAALMLAVSVVGSRRAQEELQQMRQRGEITAAAQLLTEARLRSLQAQIEPHFLYNTLANVLSLIDTQPAKARHMLERFIDFLRASLHASRAESATLGAELDLAAAYLDVLVVRMGQRLRYSIEADARARACPIAPMLLQPLVENAVMHGLEPNVAGGTIVLRAHCGDAGLLIEVADDGVGIGAAPPRAGGGVGLANVRARAHSLHGTTAQVQLLDNPDGGAIVRLLLPLNMVPPSTSPQP
jgi:signal transduction histidine kinase